MAENNDNSTQKLVGLNQFDKLAQALNAIHEKDFGNMVTLMEQLDKVKADEEALQRVEEMFGGKSLRYLTQEEYDALSDEEKEDETIVYNITDGENEIDFNTITIDSLNTTDKTLVGAINELELESFETKAELIHLKETCNNKADKSELFSGSYNDLKDKPDIPSVEGLATESFVEQQIGDISNQLANKVDVNKVEQVNSKVDLVASKVEEYTMIEESDIDLIIADLDNE